jgi:hypothetical protein
VELVFYEDAGPLATLSLPAGVRRLLAEVDSAELTTFVLSAASDEGDVESEVVLPSSPPGAFSMMVPRTRWHLRLDAPAKDELEQVLTVAALIYGATGDWKKATAAGARSVASRISRLRTENGERSVVETILTLGAPTQDDALAVLSGRVCPHANANCRLIAEDGRCAIDAPALASIVDDLVDRRILERDGPLSPERYRVIT